MSEKSDEKPSKTTNDLNETNEDEEVFTLSELLDQQREIDEVYLMLPNICKILLHN